MLSDPQLHYLDNAATSRVDPAVAQAVSEALTELWANPSSLYDPAVAAQDAIAAARAPAPRTRPTLWVSAWPPRRASRSCAPALHTLPR